MLTIGTDPEMFIANARGVPLPVCGRLGGTKAEPLDIGGDVCVQEDNVMVEYNILPQTDSFEFAEAVTIARRAVLDYVRTKMGANVKILRVASVEFTSKQLKDPLANLFGCAPEFDAYKKGNEVPPPRPAQLLARTSAPGNEWRHAGGHVHMGYGNPHDVPEHVVAAFCDAHIGLAAITWGERQGARRKLYGSAGRYRPTRYGIEYRTLSNFWTFDRDQAARVGANALTICDAIENGDPGDLQRWYKAIPWADVQRAIKQEDVAVAGSLLRYMRTELKLFRGAGR